MIGEYIRLHGPATFTAIEACDNCQTFTAPPRDEIALLFIAPHGCRMPRTWTDDSEFLTLIDNTDTTGEFMHVVTGRGSLEATDITADLRTYTELCRRVFTCTHVVEASENNYALARLFERNYTAFRLWFMTVDGYLYGGQTGIQVRYTTANLGKGGESDDVENFPLTLVWHADGSAGRVYAPLLIGKPDVPEEEYQTFDMYRQQFTAHNSQTLTWTQNSGNLPTNTTVRAWVFMNGQKLLPSQYSVTPNTGPGESTFTIAADTHFDGANYEVYTFN